jgi:hypothetical protein
MTSFKFFGQIILFLLHHVNNVTHIDGAWLSLCRFRLLLVVVEKKAPTF